MSLKDDLGNRMKENYENRAKTYLLRRVPVAIRLDMKAGHSFTKGFKRPFDHLFVTCMQETMKYLCENIQGCLLGYTQSDEITLILQDYKKLTSDAWFNYSVEKLCSISASMATMIFNKVFSKEADKVIRDIDEAWNIQKADKAYEEAILKSLEKGALFDSRCFNIPKSECTNLLLWRQMDASRNSVNMVGQAYFSHKELQNKSVSDVQDMLMLKKGINWNDYSVPEKRGSCCIKVKETQKISIDDISKLNKEKESFLLNPVNKERKVWIIDKNIPIFVNEGRRYIEDIINCEEE